MPIKYLDPKNDLTFRKIFGEHPHLLISFLNSMLPLQEGREILSIEYLDSEIIPELPGLKRSIVDVRCIDNFNRKFIVEMQMYWTSSFKSRMMFNACKAYVKQLYKKDKYSELHPVYGLSLLNEDFMKGDDMKDVYYHHYSMVHNLDSKEVIPGIELIFIELQKFKTLNYTDKKLQVLWLKFLTLIDESTTQVPEDLKGDRNIVEALEHLNYSSFNEAELSHYEKYWDTIRVEKSAIADVKEKAEQIIFEAEQEKAKALEEKQQAEMRETLERAEKEKERAEKEKERAEKEKAISKLHRTVKRFYEKGISIEEIAEDMDISIEET
ncbi:MAG: Rpn family recombination-promoting nuclease/putative transposase [Cytophagales bacterium]